MILFLFVVVKRWKWDGFSGLEQKRKLKKGKRENRKDLGPSWAWVEKQRKRKRK